MANDYDTLIERVPKWLYAQNSYLLAEMPALIQQAQDQIVGVLNHDIFREDLTPIISTTGEIDLTAEDPAVLEVRAVYVQSGARLIPLERRNYEMLKMLFVQPSGGIPLYYGESKGPLVLQLFPITLAPMSIHISAAVSPPYLTPTAKTNTITTYAYRAMEKSTQRQASLFMKDWTMAAAYKTEMMEAVVEANAQISRRRRDETGMRPHETANATGN